MGLSSTARSGSERGSRPPARAYALGAGGKSRILYASPCYLPFSRSGEPLAAGSHRSCTGCGLPEQVGARSVPRWTRRRYSAHPNPSRNIHCNLPWHTQLIFTHTYVRSRPCIGKRSLVHSGWGRRRRRRRLAGGGAGVVPKPRWPAARAADRRSRQAPMGAGEVQTAPRGGEAGVVQARSTRGQSGARRTPDAEWTRQSPDTACAWRPADRRPQDVSSGSGRRYPGGYSSRMPTRAAGW